MQVANAAMILVMIPIFNSAIYPLLARCHLLTTTLQRVGMGFFFAALAFGVSGLVDLELEVERSENSQKAFMGGILICFVPAFFCAFLCLLCLYLERRGKKLKRSNLRWRLRGRGRGKLRNS